MTKSQELLSPKLVRIFNLTDSPIESKLVPPYPLKCLQTTLRRFSLFGLVVYIW